MRTGRYAEAVDEAQRRVAEERTAENLVLLATARAAQAALIGPTDTASEALLQAVAASSRGQAVTLFANEVSGSMAFDADRFTAAVQTMAPLAQGWQGTDSPEVRRAAAALLSMAAYGADHHAPLESLQPLVRTGIALLEQSTQDLRFPDEELHTAWVAFRAAGTIAGPTQDVGARGLSEITAELAIRIAEANPDLAIPVMCDLSSPRQRLREALRERHDVDSLRRLSNAMASAEGCTLGTYAP